MIIKLSAATMMLAAALAAPAAHAAEPAAATPTSRSYVSSKGVDTAACSLPAPCRTLTRAIAQTLPRGEVVIEDSAGYGSASITKPISIVNDGLGTSVVTSPPNGAAITVNAGDGNDVHLRGLEIDGANAANSIGINLTSGNLDIVHCTINRATSNGVLINNASKKTNVTVLDTTFTDGYTGLAVLQAANVAVDKSRFFQFSYGLSVGAGSTNVSVQNSVFANNGGEGINAAGGNILVTNSKFTGGQYGIDQVGGIFLLGSSVVFGNTTGLNIATSTFFTYGNNQINGNMFSDISGTAHPAPNQ